eukprot:179000-Prymnesium_polylepis.2
MATPTGYATRCGGGEGSCESATPALQRPFQSDSDAQTAEPVEVGQNSAMYVAKPTWCSPAPPSQEPTSLATIMMRLTSHAPTIPPGCHVPNF